MRAAGRQPVLHELAVALAREAGVEPNLAQWPELERALLFGPLSAVSFRLQGPDRLASAPVRTLAAAAAFGAISEPGFTAEELQMRHMLGRGEAAAA
jgi:hypothetical protein